MTKEELLKMKWGKLVEVAGKLGVDVSSAKQGDKDAVADLVLKAITPGPDDAVVEEETDAEGDAAAEEARLAAEEEQALTDAENISLEAEHTAVQRAPEPNLSALSADWPTVDQVKEALRAYVGRGLLIRKLNAEYFHFQNGVRECAGNLKQPLKRIVAEASLLFVPTKAPTEE